MVGGVGYPGEHAHLVVELDGDHVPATPAGARRDRWNHCRVPAAHLGQKRGMQVVERPAGRRHTVPTGRNQLGMVPVHPERNPFVHQLGHHERPGPGHEPQAALGAQVDERRDVPVVPGGAGHVDAAVGQFVHEPGQVAGHRVAAGLERQVEPGAPLLARHPEIVDLAGDHQAGPTVDHQAPSIELHPGHGCVCSKTVIVTAAPVAASGPTISSIAPVSTRRVRSRPV